MSKSILHNQVLPPHRV